jgi:HEPN domain-containing protein
MKPSEIAKEWLAKAEDDYGFACAGLEDTDYFAQICFHFQQAAEKYLKTFIVANELDFRAVHNLLELLDICIRKDTSAKKLRESCIFLNPFYIDTRYPVHWPANYDKKVAVKAREAVEIIRNWTINSLGGQIL